MYNLDSHYQNILELTKGIIADCKVIYLHPFGTSQPENIESIDFVDGHSEGGLIIAYDQEPLNSVYNKYLFDEMLSTYKDKQGHNRQPLILLSTERRSKEKDILLQRYIANDVNYFFHAFAASDWYRGYRFNKSITSPSSRKLSKKYISFNRITGNSRVYRSLLVAGLQKRGIINDGYISYSEICPVHEESYKDTIIKHRKKFNLDHQYVSESIQSLDNVIHPLRIDHLDKETVQNESFSLGPIENLMSSFLHVVTETMFWDNRTHLTEKIFKPIVAKQPFILVGCANNLSYLKSYGFKTFDRWWDESYDKIFDPVERLNAIADTIEKLCRENSLEDLEQMLSDMESVLEYNYNWFYNPEFLEKCWKELEVNLSRFGSKPLDHTS